MSEKLTASARTESRVLNITPSGVIRTLYHEAFPLHSLGRLQISRGSQVEPTAEGSWTADLSPVGGPCLGPFRQRSEALAAEVAWLERHWVPAAPTR